VLVGAFLSSRAPDRYIRPAITFVIFASGLKYAGVGTTALGWILCATLLGANQLVGTDLTQAVPLTMAAALGALIFGHVEFSVTTSIIVGSVPAVIIGALFSSRAPDRYIRPAITFVIFASGLKYVGVSTTALGWILCATLLAVAVFVLAYVRPWRAGVEGQGDLDREPAVVGPAGSTNGTSPVAARSAPPGPG